MSKSILKEAIADAKELKKAALKNAQNLMLENLKEDLKEMVDEQMNEEDTVAEASSECDPDDMKKENAMEDEDVLALDMSEEGGDEDEESVDDLDVDLDEGLTEADLQEALVQALTEVDHGQLGELDEIMIDKHEHGLMDEDGKEDGWEKKKAPAAKSWQIKESAMNKRIATLVTENLTLKKTNETLRKAVAETQLFNAKLYYANKLINKPSLALESKRKIVEKLDTAKSVQEVKNIFESIEYAIGVVSESKKSPAKKQSATLSEALGIRGKMSEKGVSEEMLKEARHSVQVEGEDRYAVERFQRIAGIKAPKAQ